MAKANHDPETLKLIAFDSEDLAVISAHLQDAVMRVGDIAFLPGENRFVLVARRFDWSSGEREPRRCLTGLHFDRVQHCRTRGIDRSRADEVLSLLAMTYEEPDAPSGRLTLVFAGGGSVELELECLEAQMRDLGPVWACGGRPAHDLETI